MNYEQIYYFKLLLEIGITDEFDLLLNELLEKENPLSNLTLSLFDCNGDRNKQLHILNNYLNNIPKEQINTDFVFNMLIDKFKSIYEANPDSIEQISKDMYSIALSIDLLNEQKWDHLYCMYEYYYLTQIDVISKEDFMNSFLKLLYEKKIIDPFSKN